MSAPLRPPPLPPTSHLLRHLAKNALVALAIGLFALFLGTLGFHYLNRLDWLDATLDASLTLNGVGPVHAINGTPAKVFAAAYALLGGLAYLSTVGVLLAPLVQRFMHRLHLDLYGEGAGGTDD